MTWAMCWVSANMTFRASILVFCLAFVFSSCASQPAKKKPKSSHATVSKKMPAHVSPHGSGLYYFLVSELESMEGREPASNIYLERALSKIPNSGYLLMKKAYALARAGRMPEAKVLAQEAHLRLPNDVDVNLLLGKLNAALSLPDQAILFYQRALQLDPGNEEALGLLTQEYLNAKQGQKALGLLKKQISENPESPQGYFDLARVHASQKNIEGVIAAYRNLLDYYPDDAPTLQRLGEAYLFKKDRKRALEIFKKLRALKPGDALLATRVGLLYYELRDIDGAIATFEGIFRARQDVERTPYYLGLLYQEKGDQAKALHYFALVPSTSSLYKESVVSRVTLLKNQGRLPDAFPVAEQALKAKPSDADYYDILASLHTATKAYDRAIAVLKRGLSRLPGNERLLIEMAIVQDRKGNWQKGVEYMRKVLSLNEENVLALNFVGYIYADKNIHLDEALELVTKALKLKPTDGYIMDSLGWVYFRKGDTARSLELLGEALKLAPGEPSILEHLGWAHLKLNNKTRSRSYFESSLKALEKKKEKDRNDEEQRRRVTEALKGL